MKKLLTLIIALVLISSVNAVMYNGQEYDCEGELYEDNGVVKCRTCEQGLVLKDGKCVVNSEYRSVDEVEKVATNFCRLVGQGNEILGLFIIIGVTYVLYYLFRRKKRK